MLVIRHAQMEALRLVALDEFDRQITSHLRKDYTERVGDMSDEVLRRRVRLACGEARSFGLTWDKTISIFAILMFRVSPYFYQQPKIRAALTDATVTDVNVRFEGLGFRTHVWDWSTSTPQQLDAEWRGYEKEPHGRAI